MLIEKRVLTPSLPRRARKLRAAGVPASGATRATREARAFLFLVGRRNAKSFPSPPVLFWGRG